MDEEIIILEEETEVIDDIEIEESGSTFINSGTRHNALIDKDEPGSHTISAIDGLQKELDKIETPRVIESNICQQADYYMWEDGNPDNENRTGLFVTMHQNNDGKNVIKICRDIDTEDVFGVTVSDAGFIGNQSYIKLSDGTKIGRDGKYSLVAHSGLVTVQREENVVVGDYIVPDAFGKAKTLENKYKCGYLVTGLSEPSGVKSAIISLTDSSTIAKAVSDVLYNTETGLVGRMVEVEKDISNLTTFTNDTYELAQSINAMQNTQSSMQDTVGDLSGKVENFENRLDEVEADASVALNRSTEAQIDAANIRTEVIQKANKAIMDVEAIQKDIQALDYQVADYSVGEYSQAYGLTWKEAKDALIVGQVHIPTVDHLEFYNGYEAVRQVDGTYSNIQSFYRTYYYTWNGVQWVPSSSNSVTFAPFDTTNPSIQYWYVTADIITENGTTHTKGDLVYWNNGNPKVVASITDNGFSRSVNYLRKTTNETAMEITNARGDCTSLSEKLNSDGAKIAMVASVITEMNGKCGGVFETTEELPKAPDTNMYYCVGDNAPYDVYQWSTTNNDWIKQIGIYYDGVNFCKVNTSTIIASVNALGESEIKMDADKINFNAYDGLFITDKNGGITAINGGGILTESITASQIDATNLHVKAANIDGELTASQINVDGITAVDVDITGKINATEGNIGGCNIVDGVLKVNNANIDGELIATKVDVNKLSAITSNLGDVTAGTIWSSNYLKTTVWITAWQTSEGLEYTLNDGGTEYIVTGIGTCKDCDLIIPTVYNGLPVTSIGSSAFYGCDDLISVIIGDNIRSIGDLAFYDCSNLMSVKIPNSVISIGYLSFYGCYKLIEIYNLSSLIINAGENDNGYIGSYAKNIYTDVMSDSKLFRDGCGFIFYNDGGNYYLMGKKNISSVTNLTLPDSYNNQSYFIYQNAFSNYNNLISVNIPNNITIIGDLVFTNCPNLTSIVIPRSVISIGDAAFGWCNSLINVYYLGTQEEWLAINIGNDNSCLINATRYYYSETQPIEAGNYWHYGQDGFKLSCDDYYMINSKYFKVSSDGAINATFGSIGGISIGAPGFSSMGITSGLYGGNFALGVTNDGNGQIMFTTSKSSPDMSPYNTFINNEEVRGLHGVFYDLKIHNSTITTGSGYTYDLSDILARIESLETSLASVTSTTTE